MTEDEFKSRTRSIALRIIRLVQTLPRSPVADVIGRQLLRSGTSIGANYRAACRAKSRADFVNKLAIVEEETDESRYWIELLTDAGIMRRSKVVRLQGDLGEILAMIVSSIKTIKGGATTNPKSKIQNPK